MVVEAWAWLVLVRWLLQLLVIGPWQVLVLLTCCCWMVFLVVATHWSMLVDLVMLASEVCFELVLWLEKLDVSLAVVDWLVLVSWSERSRVAERLLLMVWRLFFAEMICRAMVMPLVAVVDSCMMPSDQWLVFCSGGTGSTS
jgi:hypothetical protein